MLPGPFGQGNADLGRLEAIASRVLADKPAWDVLCFQEVFDEDARALLGKRLRKVYPYRVQKCSDHDVFHEDSGLFFASRHPILGHRFVEYDAHAGDDALADKGVFGARLSVGGTTVLVFNTHLQASVKHHETREKQLRQVRGFVRGALGRVKEPAKTVAFACGDYNVVAEHVAQAPGAVGAPTDEYVRMIARLGWPRDLFREGRAADPGFTWDGTRNANMIPKNDHDRQRLDYVLAFDRVPPVDDEEVTAPIVCVTLEGIDVLPFETSTPKHCLSDHFAVAATLGFVA
jgi:endonuclease/exonuclease/phosphatase family metal-dependent hydrolase